MDSVSASVIRAGRGTGRIFGAGDYAGGCTVLHALHYSVSSISYRQPSIPSMGSQRLARMAKTRPWCATTDHRQPRSNRVYWEEVVPTRDCPTTTDCGTGAQASVVRGFT